MMMHQVLQIKQKQFSEQLLQSVTDTFKRTKYTKCPTPAVGERQCPACFCPFYSKNEGITEDKKQNYKLKMVELINTNVNSNESQFFEKNSKGHLNKVDKKRERITHTK